MDNVSIDQLQEAMDRDSEDCADCRLSKQGKCILCELIGPDSPKRAEDQPARSLLTISEELCESDREETLEEPNVMSIVDARRIVGQQIMRV